MESAPNFFARNHRSLFFGAWLIIGILQASLTELQDDEAYYWVYSQYLDWGYFDHPPLIGLVVKLGYAIFPNELGVRLVPLLLNTGTLLIIEKLLEKKNPLLFYAIALSLAYIQIAGYIAVPDTPLMFFTALFFLWYRNFIRNSNWLNTILLGLVMALLMYSKYHGVLIILFTLLSNFKLFRKPQAYIAVLIAAAAYMPQIIWQYQHDWVSFRYHLFESNVNRYKASYTLEYIPGQLLLSGPLIGLLLIPAAFLNKPKNETEKALRFNLIGIYLFFLLSSFRGKVEANWTSPVIVPLFILSHQWLFDKMKWQKWVYRLLPVTMVLILVGRILMIEDLVPVKAIQQRFHHWKGWQYTMKEKTKGLPVMVTNSYQRASKYWFYTGQLTYSRNLYRSRRNNYNFWPVEDSMLGKPVYIFDVYEVSKYGDSLKAPFGWIGVGFEPKFMSFAKVWLELDKKESSIQHGDSLVISVKPKMSDQYRQFISEQGDQPLRLVVALFEKGKGLKDCETEVPISKLLQPQFSFSVFPDVPKGNYKYRLGIAIRHLYPTHNSDKASLEVK